MLLKLYGTIIAEQEQQQFIECAAENDSSTAGIHYISHHPVCKKSCTFPVRIVYNCSCRQSPKQASLNECLLVGVTPLLMYVRYFYAFASTSMPCQLTLKRPFFTLSWMSVTGTLLGFYGYPTQMTQRAHSSRTDLRLYCLVLLALCLC